MLAVRFHLDDSRGPNGLLRVIPGSHLHGFLSTDQILSWPKDGCGHLHRRRWRHHPDAASPTACVIGGTAPTSRRVIDIEFG